jgi:hypothetical protein
MFCQTDNIMGNIPHIRSKYEEYYIGLTMFYEIFLAFSMNVEIFYRKLSVLRNTTMTLNNVMISMEDIEHYSIGN